MTPDVLIIAGVVLVGLVAAWIFNYAIKEARDGDWGLLVLLTFALGVALLIAGACWYDLSNKQSQETKEPQ